MASAHSEAAKMEQIVTEFFTKTLQIIAESRSVFVSSRNFSGGLSSPSSTSSSSSSSVRPRDKWFNLALRECPAALESSDLLCRGNHEPMFVDVVLVRSSPEKKSERVLERWVVHHETETKIDEKPVRKRPGSSNSNLYKKTILLLRSLYVTVRRLPAYKISHGLSSSSRISPFAIAHRVSSTSEPFSRREQAEMERFAFSPVETPAGRLSLSVSFDPSLSEFSSPDESSSAPLSSRVITDYVGSPLADPLRKRPFERPFLDEKDPGFPSLIFALSPSPPICIPGTHLPNSLLRSESAPVRIPALRLAYKQDAPLSSPLEALRSCTSFNSDKIAEMSLIGSQNKKLSCVGKEEDDDKRCFGPRLSSTSLPRVLISRGSSLSIPGDFGESDCACPFDVDGDDITNPGSRPESLEQRGSPDPIGLLSTRKSRDAAVGELVLLLRKAQPLHRDLSNSTASTPETEPDKPSLSGLAAPKTTADALEELQGYRDLKNMLLARRSKSTTHIL